jgi:hypothetical protein
VCRHAATCQTCLLTAEPLAHIKKGNAPKSLNNTLIASILQVYSERLGRFTFRALSAASKTEDAEERFQAVEEGPEAAEKGSQVDIDSVAVEDVVAVQDVLHESPSA